MYKCPICTKKFKNDPDVYVHFEKNHSFQDLDDTVEIDYNDSSVYDRNIFSIFTYGTLCQGSGYEWSKKILKLSDEVNDAKVFGFGLGEIDQKEYLTIINSDSQNTVKGQIYSCENEEKFLHMLQFADHVEGYPKLYRRKVVPVSQGGFQKMCYVYFYVGDNKVTPI